MPSIKVLLADSQYLVREGLRAIIQGQRDLEVAGEADCADELLDEIRSTDPDVIILDHDSREFFQGERLTDFLDLPQRARYLIISQEQDRRRIRRMLESGVNAFLTKYCDEEEITSAIRACVKGEKYFCTKVLDMLIDSGREDAGEDCSPANLTAREIEILRLVASGHKTRDIADQLHLSPHTVNTHRKNILKKLEIKSAPELVLYAVNTGIVKTAVRSAE